MLQALKAMGVQVALDSLSYLRRFPIDALKIDRSFVQEITSESNDAPIIRAVISMGTSIKLRVVAEGVETQEQLAFVQGSTATRGKANISVRPCLPNNSPSYLSPLCGKPSSISA